MTGSQKDAGTDFRADIRVTLIGDKGRSDGDQIQGWWEIIQSHNLQYDDVIMECHGNLGQVQVSVAGEESVYGILPPSYYKRRL